MFTHLKRVIDEARDIAQTERRFANQLVADCKALREAGCYNISVKRAFRALAALVEYTDNRGCEHVCVMDDEGRFELMYGSEVPQPEKDSANAPI